MAQNYNIGIYCLEIIDEYGSVLYYVGQSTSLSSRRSNHLSDLAKGIHCKKEIQSIYNRLGSSVIKFYILEYCRSKDLLKVEASWINKLGPNCNIANKRVNIGLDFSVNLLEFNAKEVEKNRRALLNIMKKEKSNQMKLVKNKREFIEASSALITGGENLSIKSINKIISKNSNEYLKVN